MSAGGGSTLPEQTLPPAPAPEAPATVLIVDDDAAQVELFRGMLAREGYHLDGAHDGEAAMRLVAERAPDVVLLDLQMPEADGFAVLEQMQGDAWMRRIPVVVVTASDERTDRLRALEMGAADFLGKPVDREELRARVRSLVRAKRHADDSEQAESVILALARTSEARDPTLRGHHERLSHVVVALAQDLGCSGADQLMLRRGAHLHDIGTLALPDGVLQKAGPLDPTERALVRSHPVLGEKILRPLRTLDGVRDLVRHHHERLDGSGYPDGLTAEQLSLSVRILAVAEVFDALTSVRPHRPAWPVGAALGLLRAEGRRGWWDEAVIDSLARLVTADRPDS